MTKTVRLRRINVWQASKISAILYLVLFAIIFIPLGLFTSFLPDNGAETSGFLALGSGMIMFMLPVFYAIFGFVITAIGCALYNLVAGWTGGFEIEVSSFQEEETH